MAMYMNRDAPGSGLASLMAMQGRYGDTELVHMNPMEVKMFDAMTPGGLTRNPDTGAPEGFAWWLPILGAAVGGIAGGAKGGGFKNVLKGAALGGLAGLGGAGFMSATGIGATAAGGMGSAWGPFTGLQGLFGGTGGAVGGSGMIGGGFGLPTNYIPGVGGLGSAAGTSVLAPSVGAAMPYMGSGVPTGAGNFGFAVNPMTAGATQSAIPGIAAIPKVTGTAGGNIPPMGFNYQPPPTLSELDITKMGGARNVSPPNTWERLKAIGRNFLPTSSTTDTEATTPATNAYEQTWIERNRLPITGAAMAGTLLANQGPTAADFPSTFGTARKATESLPVTGRKVRELDEITGEEIEEGVEGEGLGAFFEEEDDIVANKKGGIVELWSGGAPGSTLSGLSVFPSIISAGPQAVAQEVERQSYGNKFPTSAFANPQTRAVTQPLVIDALSQREDWPSSWGGIGAGEGGTEQLSIEELSTLPQMAGTIIGRSPRTARDFSTFGSGNLTEDEILAAMTGETAGGLPNLLSSSSAPSGFSEDEIVASMISNAHGGSVFEGQVHTTGDGMSDDRRFNIVESPQGGGMGFLKDTDTDAVIARDEYVWPADAVSMLGNGSSNAGADILDKTVKQIRQASVGHKHQVNQIDGKKELKKALTT